MEIVNFLLNIFVFINLWRYFSLFTIFGIYIIFNILEYIAYNGNSIKYNLDNTKSNHKKIIYGFSYGINLGLIGVGSCINNTTNYIISTRIGNYLYCQLCKVNLKFLELKTRFFQFIINKLLKTILSFFYDEKVVKEEMKKIEEKKKNKKVLDSDEEITRFLNEIMETIKD